VVVLAHLDHLGRGWPDVRVGNEGVVHPGADDNASGVAALLELARAMKVEPPRPRPVLFAVVTAEEAGRIGSRRLLEGLTTTGAPLACVNLDTVGRLSEQLLISTPTPPAVALPVHGSRPHHRDLDRGGEGAARQLGPDELHRAGVPGVQLFTGP
jgi:Zn-dependent M28 family amino/carboxypeptidase